jgi:hypothetical protein
MRIKYLLTAEEAKNLSVGKQEPKLSVGAEVEKVYTFPA